MQLAQYVSTIANGGYRIQPHIVKEVTEPTENGQLGPIISQVPTKVLDRIVEPSSWIQRVQTGFHMVYDQPGGTLYSFFTGVKYDPAGKSGTAQAFDDKGNPVINLSLIGFAPFNNPEVAIAVLVPAAYNSAVGPEPNAEIARQVFDYYFQLKQQRATAAAKTK